MPVRGAENRDLEMPADPNDAPERPLLTIHIVTLFPALFENWLRQGVVSRAIQRKVARVLLTDLRSFGIGRHQITDDYPYGGGPGMIMKPEPLFAAISSLHLPHAAPIILLSPRGPRFKQATAQALAGETELVLVAGHYEGVDERVREHVVTSEISIGDFVLSCGELAAMVVADAIVRLLPGALSSGATEEESFAHGLLEYPQYTRPAQYQGWKVPDVLLSGHHGEIRTWRRTQALKQTYLHRPDLLEEGNLTPEEKALVNRWKAGDVEDEVRVD